MTRIKLTVYIAPGQVEVTGNIKLNDGSFQRFMGVVDTGAEVSLLPLQWLDRVQHRLSEPGKITISQAGIAKQDFQATEAYVTIFLEDAAGIQTKPFEIIAWFTPTRQTLIGFQDVLDRAVLHIDMPKQDAWLEIDE